MKDVETSAKKTTIWVIILFLGAIVLTLIAPMFVDHSWTMPSSDYQVQMYEVADPNIYISTPRTGGQQIQYVYHLKNNFTLLSFQESDSLRIVAPQELQKYITKKGDDKLTLTSRLLMLRKPEEEMTQAADEVQKTNLLLHLNIYELYDPKQEEAFALAETDGILESWVDENFTILDPSADYHHSKGVLYVANPTEYRVKQFTLGRLVGWEYNPLGQQIGSVEELTKGDLAFISRQELIRLGEHIYAIEGCWYCHTDQSRTLVQDCVLNGAEQYPAPPSTANEYIYQNVTFPGTRRIGPDMARVGIKKPNRDWHLSHFWAPKTESPGSIMPAFRHFFDNDPHGSPISPYGVPNYRFEAIYQYLMTKGTRITPPTQAWWLNKDPVHTIDIIEGKYAR